MSTEPAATESSESLTARLTRDLAQRWRDGERPLAEEYLNRHPELWQDGAAAADLILEEILRRQEVGEAQASITVMSRFPQWRAQLEVLLQCHRALEPGPVVPVYPEAGSVLGEFLLAAELGRGGQGRVFLATQPALANRPVVLKLAPPGGLEHLSLARVQHTNIVPLFGVHDFPTQRLQGLCMPYFGGATMDRLLARLTDCPVEQRTGKMLLVALDRIQAERPLQLRVGGAARQLLQHASYVQAICWLGAHLADALQYAHERGLVHLDIKPANILLTADAQPMLLDFHLAHEAIPAGTPPPEWLGGTPGYTSPEQLLCIEAVRRGKSVPQTVDGRSDLYSLGIFLLEALGGNASNEGAPFQFLCNRVSVGLAEIVRKCLVRAPGERYASAATLAEDLRRHINDLPLRGVPNRSLRERWGKWRRRRPHDLRVFALALLVLVGVAVGLTIWLSHHERQRQQLRSILGAAQAAIDQHRPTEALALLQQARPLAADLPDSSHWHERIQAQISAAQRDQAIANLHFVVNRLRVLHSSDLPNAPDLRSFEVRCHALWHGRDKALDQLRLDQDSDTRRQIDTDFLDLAILWSDLRVHLARREDKSEARGEAMQVLDDAEARFGVSPALLYERQRLARDLGLDALADKTARKFEDVMPRSAWDHYALGRAFLKDGKVAMAAPAFEEALRQQPQNLWANFYLGLCAYRGQRYDDAIVAFTTCVALAPQVAASYHNRALAYQAGGRRDRALRDYDRALQLDPSLSAALLNRGILHFQEERFASARADLEAAKLQGADPALVGYNLALICIAQGDRDSGRKHLQQVLRHDPDHKEAHRLLLRMQ